MGKFFLTHAISILLVSFQTKTYAAPVSASNVSTILPKSSDGFIGHDPASSTHVSGGDEYIILFKSGSHRKRSLSVTNQIAQVLMSIDLSLENDDVTNIFNGSIFNGFSAKMQSHCIDALNAMEDVEVVEKVQQVQAHRVSPRATEEVVVVVDNEATWGLQAISSSPQTMTNLTGFSHQYMVEANSTLGQGVDVYVLDTGINTAHEVFALANGSSRADLQSLQTTDVDDDGHGTHVSGTIGGLFVGVSSAVTLHGIKILDSQGSGSTTIIVQGMQAVADAHAQRKTQPGFIGSVVNLSLGGTYSQALNAAAAALTQAGIHVVVSAGNESDDACNYSPSGQGGINGDVISVGSIGPTFAISSFSNTGQCVDLYAPGESVISSWITSDTSLEVLQGTSMSCPHVTGLVAYFMSNNPSLGQNPAAMKAMVKNTALSGTIQGNSSLLLANNGL